MAISRCHRCLDLRISRTHSTSAGKALRRRCHERREHDRAQNSTPSHRRQPGARASPTPDSDRLTCSTIRRRPPSAQRGIDHQYALGVGGTPLAGGLLGARPYRAHRRRIGGIGEPEQQRRDDPTDWTIREVYSKTVAKSFLADVLSPSGTFMSSRSCFGVGRRAPNRRVLYGDVHQGGSRDLDENPRHYLAHHTPPRHQRKRQATGQPTGPSCELHRLSDSVLRTRPADESAQRDDSRAYRIAIFAVAARRGTPAKSREHESRDHMPSITIRPMASALHPHAMPKATNALMPVR